MMGLFKSVCAKITFLLAVAASGTVSAAAMPAGSHAWMVFFGIPTQYNGYMTSAPARVPEPTTGVLLLAGLSLACIHLNRRRRNRHERVWARKIF